MTGKPMNYGEYYLAAFIVTLTCAVLIIVGVVWMTLMSK
jgi:hypothetical protein